MFEEWDGQERRSHLQPCAPQECPFVSDEHVNRIAERAADVALEKVYGQIGKSVVSKFLWVVGALVLAAAAWLKGKGVLG